MGGRLNQKRILYVAILAIIVIAVVVGLSEHNKHKASQPTSFSTKGPSNAMVASTDSSNAQKAIGSQNYKAAVNYYIEAVNAAEAAGNLNQAESLLKEATSKIPDNNVPWELWDDLVGVAKAKGDKSLEISSLKKAIIKAQQPNSGAPSGIVDVYKKMLKQLGAG